MNLRSPHRIYMLVLVPLIVWLLYSGLVHRQEINMQSKPQNFFKWQARSFAHGRLDIPRNENQTKHDLSRYQDKYFLYWPPAPVLFYMPFAFSNIPVFPDSLMISILGAINAFLFLLLLFKLSDQLKLHLTEWEILVFVLAWSLGTVHWYMSTKGTVWFFSQVAAQTYLLLACVVFPAALNVSRLIIAGCFFALACFSRNNLVFTFPFFLSLMWAYGQAPGFRKLLIRSVQFLIPFVVCLGIYLWYNYARFGNPMENGISYHLMADRFQWDYDHLGYWNIRYVPTNIYTEIIKPFELQGGFPFIKWDPLGFGMIWASPFLLLLIPGMVRTRQLRIELQWICWAALVSAALVAAVIFLIMGNGWMQFAARYTLDFQLMLFMALLISGIYRVPWARVLFYFLILIAIIVQLNGLFLAGTYLA